jgi:hypothetical protein
MVARNDRVGVGARFQKSQVKGGDNMSADLVLGELDASLERHVARIAERVGLNGYSSFVGRPEERVTISAIDVASLDLFNSYAARLEGLTDTDAMDKTTYRNLPWWLQSVWLPIEFDPPKDLASDEGDPLFVGSCGQLLSELAEIQKKSDLELGAVPDAYHVMRSDHGTWFRSALDRDDVLSESDTIRWIWRSLNDGAGISKQKRVPMTLLA